MSTPDIIKVDLSHFPTDERFAQIPGKLVLADNLEDDFEAPDRQNNSSFPVQIAMAVSMICISGKIDMKIDLNQYTLTNGSTMLILPGSFFQLLNVDKGTKCLFMAISPEFIIHVGDVKLGIEFGRKLKNEPIHHPSTKDLEEHITIYKELKRKLTDEQYIFKEEIAQSYLHILQCNVFQQFVTNTKQKQENKPASRKEELFVKFMSIVKKHYTEHRNITFYADKLFVSSKYLSSVVHDVSGNYATDWINQHVILEAKAMLRAEGMSVKDVSNRLNFANQSFFAKYFKKHTGYTPKEYKAL